MTRRRPNALRHGATARPDTADVEAEAAAILGDLVPAAAQDPRVVRAARALAAATLALEAASRFSAKVAEVDPRSTFRRELEMIDDLLDDLVASLPYAHEAVARRVGLLRASVTIEAADRRRAARYLAEATSARGKALARFLEAVRVAGRADTAAGYWSATPWV